MFEEGQWFHWGILWMEWRAQVSCPNNLRTWLGLNNDRVLFQNHIWKQFCFKYLESHKSSSFWKHTQESETYTFTYILSVFELEDNKGVMGLILGRLVKKTKQENHEEQQLLLLGSSNLPEGQSPTSGEGKKNSLKM